MPREIITPQRAAEYVKKGYSLIKLLLLGALTLIIIGAAAVFTFVHERKPTTKTPSTATTVANKPISSSGQPSTNSLAPATAPTPQTPATGSSSAAPAKITQPTKRVIVQTTTTTITTYEMSGASASAGVNYNGSTWTESSAN